MHHGLEQISWGESGGGQRRAGNILIHARVRIHPKLFGSAIWHRSLLQTSDQGGGDQLMQTADNGGQMHLALHQKCGGEWGPVRALWECYGDASSGRIFVLLNGYCEAMVHHNEQRAFGR